MYPVAELHSLEKIEFQCLDSRNRRGSRDVEPEVPKEVRVFRVGRRVPSVFPIKKAVVVLAFAGQREQLAASRIIRRVAGVGVCQGLKCSNIPIVAVPTHAGIVIDNPRGAFRNTHYPSGTRGGGRRVEAGYTYLVRGRAEEEPGRIPRLYVDRVGSRSHDHPGIQESEIVLVGELVIDIDRVTSDVRIAFSGGLKMYWGGETSNAASRQVGCLH